MPKLPYIIRRLNRRQIGFLILFVIAGTIALALTLAANTPVSFEAEQSCREDIGVNSDASASGGQYLQFGNGTPPTKTVPSCYSLVWQEDFAGNVLNANRWNTLSGPARDAINTPDAVTVEDGDLVLTTYSEGGKHYTGVVDTRNKYMPRYGYIEARIKATDRQGMWSGFWIHNKTVNILGDPWSNGVEMDILEHWGTNQSNQDVSDTANAGIHWDGYGDYHKFLSPGLRGSSLKTGYHTYAVEWTPDSQKYYIDGKFLWSLPNTPSTPTSQRHQHFILSSEIENGVFAGTIPSSGYGSRESSSTKFKVDYIRVYQKQPSAPQPPSDLEAHAGVNQVNLQWEVSPNATGYVVKRSTSPSGPFTTVATQGFNYLSNKVNDYTNNVTYSDTSVDNDTYYYVVAATSSSGEGTASLPVRVAYPGENLARGRPGTVSDSTSASQQAAAATDGNRATEWQTNPPLAPDHMTIDLGSARSISYARVAWTQAYAKTYSLRGSTDGNTWTTLKTMTNQNGDLDMLTFSAATVRYVRLEATEQGTTEYGIGVEELEVYAAPPNIPHEPGSLAAVAGDQRIKLSWDGTPGTDAYLVKRATDIGGPYTTVDTITAGTSYTETGLNNGTMYYYIVTAKNTNGESSPSAEINKTPRANLALAQPARSSTETWSHEEYRAFDANPSSYWQSANTAFEWTYVNLQATYSVNRVKLLWGTTYAKGYKIQTSLDGTNWSDAFSTSTANGSTDDITFTARTARYVRFSGQARSAAAGYTLKEFEVYGSP